MEDRTKKDDQLEEVLWDCQEAVEVKQIRYPDSEHKGSSQEVNVEGLAHIKSGKSPPNIIVYDD